MKRARRPDGPKTDPLAALRPLSASAPCAPPNLSQTEDPSLLAALALDDMIRLKRILARIEPGYVPDAETLAALNKMAEALHNTLKRLARAE